MLTESISDTFIPWRSKAFSLKSSISPGCTKYLISLAVKKAGRKSSINNSCFFILNLLFIQNIVLLMLLYPNIMAVDIIFIYPTSKKIIHRPNKTIVVFTLVVCPSCFGMGRPIWIYHSIHILHLWYPFSPHLTPYTYNLFLFLHGKPFGYWIERICFFQRDRFEIIFQPRRYTVMVKVQISIFK